MLAIASGRGAAGRTPAQLQKTKLVREIAMHHLRLGTRSPVKNNPQPAPGFAGQSSPADLRETPLLQSIRSFSLLLKQKPGTGRIGKRYRQTVLFQVRFLTQGFLFPIQRAVHVAAYRSDAVPCLLHAVLRRATYPFRSRKQKPELAQAPIRGMRARQ